MGIQPVSGRRALAAGGLLSAGIALLHVVIIFVGAPAYRYFGAGEEMAQKAAEGSYFPALLTAIVTLFFALFAFYGLAGAQVAPRPPLLRTGLIAIGAIYTLRGLLLAPQLAAYMSNAPLLAPKDLVFSAVSLVIGLLYLLGTWQAWPNLRTAKWRVA
ncbi:MAG TPA: hypothetical protein VMW27_01695 [Thermoanaerobaculia bacterium]|nr:hypothetical protein [Thermoanaerobaculia bacterium]